MGVGLTALSFQSVWSDYDRDGDLDLYLSNDRAPLGFPPNHLWRNDGGSFTDVSSDSGAGVGLYSMGLAAGDFDRRRGKLPAQRAKREDGPHVTCDAMRNGPPSRKVLDLHRESHSTPALSMRAAGPPRPGPTRQAQCHSRNRRCDALFGDSIERQRRVLEDLPTVRGQT